MVIRTLKCWKVRLAVICGFLMLNGQPGLATTDGISYIPNRGQWNPQVAYRAQLSHGRFFLEKQGFTYTFLDPADLEKMHHQKALSGTVDAHALQIRFNGARRNPTLRGANKTGTTYNYYLGDDPKAWQQGLPGYQTVEYQGLYPGIDLAVTSRASHIKYNFRVAPGKNPEAIKLAYAGADDLYLDEANNLVVQTSVNQFREMAPKAYQVIDGEKKRVPCRYQLKRNQLSFAFPKGYNDRYPLIIDPEVIFSTFSGSLADNFGYSATFDSAGHGYSAGTVFGSNYPDTTGPGGYQESFGGGADTSWGSSGGARDIGILKYNDSGTDVKYVTFLGGSGNEDPHSMVVNSDQDLLVFGNTGSADFPVTPKAYDTSYNGNYDIYVSKLSANGDSLMASTYVGGQQMDGLNGIQEVDSNRSDLGWNYGDMFRGEVIVDDQDRALVATITKSGQSFPVTANAFQTKYGGGDQDGCAFRLSADLQQLQGASFVGGSQDDAGYSLTLAPDQSILMTGGTESSSLNFPVNGYQQTNQGGVADGFLLRMSQDFTQAKSATFLGTAKYDQSYFIQTDRSGDVYVTGQTASNQFPTRQAGYSIDSGKQFISKFNPQLDSLLISATFGSGQRPNPDLSPSAFLVDTCGRIYFSGWGGRVNFNGYAYGLPVTPDAFDTSTDGSDFYLTVFARDMQRLLYGTYYGGGISGEHVDGGTSRFDKGGTIYQSICAGCGGYSDLPTTKNAYSRINRGDSLGSGCNNALLKIELDVDDLFAGFKHSGPSCLQQPVSFTSQAQLADSTIWYFGDGDTSTKAHPSHQYDTAGTYNVQQIAINPSSCVLADTARQTISVYANAGGVIRTDTGACVNVRNFAYAGKYGSQYRWKFGDGSAVIQDSAVTHTYADTGTYVATCIVNSGTACADTLRDTVRIGNTVKADFSTRVDSCTGRATFINTATGTQQFTWVFEGQEMAQTGLDTIQYEYNRSDTFYPRLIAAPKAVCADTAQDTLELEGLFTRFRYTVTDPCQFEVRLSNASKFSDAVSWALPDTTFSGPDTIQWSFPGPGRYRVAMWREGAPEFCQDTARKTIKLDTLPDVNFSVQHPTCQPYLSVITDSGQLQRIQWQLSSQSGTYDSTFTALPNGDQLPLPAARQQYSVRAVGGSSQPCPDTVVKQVTVDTISAADFSVALDTCNQTITTTNRAPRNIQYKWQFGDRAGSPDYEPTHQYSEAGNYPITLITQDGLCRDTAATLVEVLPIPEASFQINSPDCSPVVAFESEANEDHEHFWQLGEGDTSRKVAPFKRFQDTGSYNIQLVLGPDDHCADTQRQTFRIEDFVEADFSATSADCRPVLNLKADPLHADSIEWGGAIQPYLKDTHRDSIALKLDSAGLYKVSLIARSHQCIDTLEKTVVVNPQINGRFTYEPIPCQPKIRFRAKASEAINHKWHWGDGQQTSNEAELIHTYQQRGRYPVMHIARPGTKCADTVIKEVTLRSGAFQQLDVPNVFTPNGDGTNDRFQVQGLKNCDQYELFIYNRWGQEVYHSTGQDLSWNGHDQQSHRPLPSGTYLYTLQGPQGFQQEGTVELMRSD